MYTTYRRNAFAIASGVWNALVYCVTLVHTACLLLCILRTGATLSQSPPAFGTPCPPPHLLSLPAPLAGDSSFYFYFIFLLSLRFERRVVLRTYSRFLRHWQVTPIFFLLLLSLRFERRVILRTYTRFLRLWQVIYSLFFCLHLTHEFFIVY